MCLHVYISKDLEQMFQKLLVVITAMVGVEYLKMLCTHFLHAVLTEHHGSLFISSADVAWDRVTLLSFTDSHHFHFTQSLKASYLLCFTKIIIYIITLIYSYNNMFKDEFV